MASSFASNQKPNRICPKACHLLFLISLLVVQSAVGQAIDSSLVARFQLADSYLRAGQFDRAIPVLEDLYEQKPETYVFFDKLREAYESIKAYEEAITLTENRLTIDANKVGLTSDIARLYYLKGDEATADEYWERAIAQNPGVDNAYRVVYQSLIEVRLFDKAVNLLEAGREEIGQKNLFQVDLAYLYSLTGAHDKAMLEYLGLLGENERQLSYVRNRLNRFIEQENVITESVPVVEEAVRKNPLNRAYRELLGWLYLEDNQFDQALDVYRAIDRLEKEQGVILFTFAEQAADASAFPVAAEAYNEVLTRYPDSPIAPDALRGTGEMIEKQAEEKAERAFDNQGNRIEAPLYESALSVYRQFLQDYPSHPYYPDILRRISRLQQDVFFDLGAAEATLSEVFDRFPNSPAAAEGQYDVGRIALMRGDLQRARIAFSRLEEELRLGELAEKARYELALLHFYSGEFDAAMSLSAILNENTSTDVANDAIGLKVLLMENKGPDSLNTPLKRYAEASLLSRQRRYDQSLVLLDSLLTQYGSHPLADDVRFLRAETLRNTGRIEESLAALLEFRLIHPLSFFTDRSLFVAGEIYEIELNDKALAIETYATLLDEYPGSLLATRARMRIRFLRGDGI